MDIGGFAIAKNSISITLCKEANANGDSGNGAYRDQPDTKQEGKDLTSTTLGFSTPEYAKRFAKALRHTVGWGFGNPSPGNRDAHRKQPCRNPAAEAF